MAKRKAQGKTETPATAEPSMLDQIKGVLAAEMSAAEMLPVYRGALEAVRDQLDAAPALESSALSMLAGELKRAEDRIAELSAGRGCAKCGDHDHAGAVPCACACHVPIEVRYTALAEAIETAIALPRAAVVDLATARQLIKSRMDDLSGIVR